MQIVENEPRRRRLLESAAVHQDQEVTFPVRQSQRYEVQHSGRGRAILMGLLLGTLLIVGAGYLHQRHVAFVPDMSALSRKFMAVRTHSVLSSKRLQREKLNVDLGAESLRVTSIALGHPRLAVINGQQVAEGDTLTVEDGGVTVTLRVIDIADGRIELANGTHIITTLLPTR